MSRTFEIIRFLLGLGLLGMAFAMFPFIPGTIVCAVFSGICLYPFISAPVERWITGFIWPNRDKYMRLVKDYSRIRSLLTEHEYEAAYRELSAELKAAPESIEGWRLLADILHDHLHRPAEALEVITRQLHDHAWQPGIEPLVLLGVDIHLQAGDQAAAIRLLQEALRLAGQAPVSPQLLERLMHLESPLA